MPFALLGYDFQFCSDIVITYLIVPVYNQQRTLLLEERQCQLLTFEIKITKTVIFHIVNKTVIFQIVLSIAVGDPNFTS